MTPEEKVAAKRTARLIRAARKQLSLTQETVASRLSISQSALSKMEHASLIPSAIQWFDFCRLTGISTDSLVTGYIERMRPAVLEEGLREGTFKIPKRYATHRGSKVRAMLPFLRYLESKLGEAKTKAYLKELKLDPDFFIDFDNQISIQFCMDIAKDLMNKGLLKPDNLTDLTRIVTSPSAHGSLSHRYDSQQDVLNLMNVVLMNSRHYECNFNYRIEAQKEEYLDMSIEPEKHMADTRYKSDPDLGDFLCQYKKSYFETITHFGRIPGAKLEELECQYHGASKCVYRLKIAA